MQAASSNHPTRPARRWRRLLAWPCGAVTALFVTRPLAVFEWLGRAGLRSAGFPGAGGARERARLYRSHVALIAYEDVVEFEGSHIRRFYSQMAERFQAFIDAHSERLALQRKLRPGTSPLAAIMVASRFLLNCFAVELVFGVPHHFGQEEARVLREISDILTYGMLPAPASSPEPATS